MPYPVSSTRGKVGNSAFVVIPPDEISGLLCWYKADAGTFQLSNGTTAATADTDPVGYWADQSGNDYHATQATADLRPVLKTGANGINSLPVVRGDGAGDYLRTASITSGVTTGDYWMLCVYRPVVLGGDFMAAYGTYDPAWKVDGGDGENTNQFYWSTGGYAFNTVYQANTAYIGEFGRDSGTHKSFINGSQEARTSTFAGTSSLGDAALTLFAAGNNNWSANLDIGEFVFYANKPSAGNLAGLRNYLNDRWAVY